MLRKKRNSALKIAISLLLIMSLTGCSISGKDKKESTTKSPAASEKAVEKEGMDKEEAYVKASEYMRNMTLEEKVGQLFVVNRLTAQKAVILSGKNVQKRWLRL